MLGVGNVDLKPACAHFKLSAISSEPPCLTCGGKPEIRTDDTKVNGKQNMCSQYAQQSKFKFKNISSSNSPSSNMYSSIIFLQLST